LLILGENLNNLQAFIIVGVIVVFLFAWFRWRHNPRIAFFLVVGLLIGTGITLLFNNIPYLNTGFARSLGHAFIIAAILAATVDHYLKERVLREISLDVSKYLVGYRLPEEVQDRIRELMQTKWIRRKFEVRFSFAEARNQRVKLDVRIAEEIQNITAETLDYQDSIEFEKHDPATPLELQYDGDPAAAYHLDKNALTTGRVEKQGSFIYCGPRIRIPSVADSLGHVHRFRARYEILYPIPHSELITFSRPTIGVSIEISDNPLGLTTYVDPPADVVTHNRFEYKRLFLPGEHIRLYWEKNVVEAKAGGE
jgi:hypothetical protein